MTTSTARRRSIRIGFCTCLVFLITGCASVKIDRVLPFTPTADSVRVQTHLAKGSENAHLTATLRPWKDKTVVWSGPLSSSDALVQNLPVRPWSPGNPNLYSLTVTASEKGKKPHSKTVRFGFRQVESRNGNVYLNGQPIFLRGLAINPPNRTVPEKVGPTKQFAYDYVKYLRDQHVNLIRLEPANQDWFDVCDELGMMVYQGFYGSPPTGLSKDEEAAQKKQQQKLATQDEAAGKRLPPDFDRSMAAYRKEFETYVRHPSIIIYVLSNELPYKDREGELVHDFLTRAYDHLAQWDHTRLYIGNAGYGEGKQGDINDVHRYWGWYYNSFTTYYNLRNPKLFGVPEKNQPQTFSEAVGCFTGPNGAWNYIERKQLAAGLGWTGHAADQPAEAQAYQGFMNKQALEIFRRLRAINPRISGIMPFTITFHNWRGIKSFAQMNPTAAAKQFGTSYQPVLLSFEHWQPQVYAGAKTTVFAHIVNDSDDFKDLSDMLIEWKLISAADNSLAGWGQAEVPPVKYYGTWRGQIDVTPAAAARDGQYRLVGQLKRRGEVISTNETPIFVASRQWAQHGPPMQRWVRVIGDSTAKALSNLGIDNRPADLSRLDPGGDMLLIGEEAWNEKLTAAKTQLRDFVSKGGRILVLGQPAGKFDTSWLPSEVKMLTASVNDPTYGQTMVRPSADQTHVNPERPDHPVFSGVDRHQLQLWSDYTGWDETKDGFPRISPMRFGFALPRQDDLKHTAILANYDAGLQAVALAEMFDGAGSVLLSGFDIVRRNGVDPVADRMLVNLVSYMAGDARHEVHPYITSAIKWGDFASERGVIGGPVCGLFRNTDWQVPPTDPKAKPLTDGQSGWNTKPSDQFLPNGVRPRGPYHYTFNCSPRDVEPKNPNGSGMFFATIPPGRKNVVTRVRNDAGEPASLRVDVNDVQGKAVSVPARKTITIRTPIPGGATDVGVRYSGNKELIILETGFQ